MKGSGVFVVPLLVFLVLGGVRMANKEPRGIRNNNPGNIRIGAKWQGLAAVQSDPSFAVFVSPEYGMRALAKILVTYYRRYGLRTIREVITRYAPSSENNTAAYIDAVAKHVGASPDAPLNLSSRTVLIPMMEAITRHENGQQPYSLALFNKALTMAGVA